MKASLLLLCAPLLLACASTGTAVPDPEPAARLEAALLALPGSTRPADAQRLARTALAITQELRAQYRPLRPPQLGNLAFHLGLRDRALCCHWAEDLLRALSAQDLPGFRLHWGVAHHGSQLREHSVVVAVPAGEPFEHGLVLDAWRNAGELYWRRVDQDRYPWQLHPSDALRDRLACRASDRG